MHVSDVVHTASLERGSSTCDGTEAPNDAQPRWHQKWWLQLCAHLLGRHPVASLVYDCTQLRKSAAIPYSTIQSPCSHASVNYSRDICGASSCRLVAEANVEAGRQRTKQSEGGYSARHGHRNVLWVTQQGEIAGENCLRHGNAVRGERGGQGDEREDRSHGRLWEGRLLELHASLRQQHHLDPQQMLLMYG